jgi:hypothetical protein
MVTAHSEAEISASLELERLTDRPWHIQNSDALKGTGVNDGLSWLSEVLKRSK